MKHGLLKKNQRNLARLAQNEAPEGRVFLSGYWQSEHFFDNVKAQVKTLFQFPALESPQAQALRVQIADCEQSVAVHIRRGDYVGHALHDICGQDYYLQAMQRMSKEHPDATYFIFSDDIDDCRSFLPDTCHFVEGTVSDIEDLHLMSLCKHNILSNSSYSWWGAWLGEQNDSCVITPNRWFNDEALNDEWMKTYKIVPERWVQIAV